MVFSLKQFRKCITYGSKQDDSGCAVPFFNGRLPTVS